MTVSLFDKEHYELLEQFEREYQLKPDAREKDKEWWKRGYVYSNGETNRDFVNYRRGYSYGKVLAEVRAAAQPQKPVPVEAIRKLICYGIPLGATNADWNQWRDSVAIWLDSSTKQVQP